MSIRADDWGRIRAVFDVAVGLSGAERQAHVDRACAQDPELRRQVEALLGSHDRADTFLETPARVLISEPVDVPDEIAGRRIGS